MTCCICNNDLADCTCPDLKARLEKICECTPIYIHPEYKARILKQAEKNISEQVRTE